MIRIVITTLGYGTDICHEDIVTSIFQNFLYKSILHKDFVKWLAESINKEITLLQSKMHWT